MILELPILKQLAEFGAFEEKIVRKVFSKQEVGAVNKRLLKRKVVKFGMKENEVRNVSIKKIANGFVFEIKGFLYSEKQSNGFGGQLGVELTKTFYSATRASGSRSLEKKLALFGGEIREKLLKREREYVKELEKREKECRTSC